MKKGHNLKFKLDGNIELEVDQACKVLIALLEMARNKGSHGDTLSIEIEADSRLDGLRKYEITTRSMDAAPMTPPGGLKKKAAPPKGEGENDMLGGISFVEKL